MRSTQAASFPRMSARAAAEAAAAQAQAAAAANAGHHRRWQHGHANANPAGHSGIKSCTARSRDMQPLGMRTWQIHGFQMGPKQFERHRFYVDFRRFYLNFCNMRLLRVFFVFFSDLMQCAFTIHFFSDTKVTRGLAVLIL